MKSPCFPLVTLSASWASRFPAPTFRLALLLLLVLPIGLDAQMARPFRSFFPVEKGSGDSVASAVLIAGDLLIIGQQGIAQDTLQSAGAVEFVSIKTGKSLRTLRSPNAAANGFFGASLAVSGNRLFVGAWGENRVYEFSLPRGTLVQPFIPLGALGATPRFGVALAVEGNRLAVGASGDNSDRGAVFMFDIRSGLQTTKMVSSFPSVNASFGNAVAMSGGLVLVGASGYSSNTGHVELMDGTTGQTIQFSLADDGGSGESFGISTALRGETGFVGASSAGSNSGGTIYHVAASQGLVIRHLRDPLGNLNSKFGRALALFDNCLVGVTRQNTVNGSGVLVFFDLVSGEFRGRQERFDAFVDGPYGATVDVHHGQLAVGLFADERVDFTQGLGSSSWRRVIHAEGAQVGASFLSALHQGKLQSAALSSSGSFSIRSFLTGAGSRNGRNQTVFVGTETSLFEPITGMSLFPGTTIGAFPNVWSNQSGSSFMIEATLKGPNASKDNNQLLLIAGGQFRTGTKIQPESLINGQLSRAFRGTVQASRSVNNTWATSYLLKQGVEGVDKTNDSGLRLADLVDNPTKELVNEGSSAPSGVNDPQDPIGHGEFLPRLAIKPESGTNTVAYTSFLAGAPAGTGLGLFRRRELLGTDPIARQGSEAAGTGGAVFSMILGETISSTDIVVFRASLRGATVNSGNNEGIWRRRLGQAQELIARKGSGVLGLTGASWKRFLGFWAIGNQTLILGQISGPEVNARNDTVLMLLQENDVWLPPLMREGDPAPGARDARLGVLQRVDADPVSGIYAVQASLTGGPKAANQAVFLGGTLKGGPAPINTTGRRFPHFLMRKGGLFQPSFGEALGRPKSISIPLPVAEVTGAKGTGVGRCVSAAEDGMVLLDILYAPRVRHLVKATLP